MAGDDKKNDNDKKYETFSITMELERPLLDNVDPNPNPNAKTKTYIRKKKRVKRKFILVWILIVLVVLLFAFLTWANSTYKPGSLARESLISNSKVEVKKGKFISFSPVNGTPKKGLIFYPSDKIKAEAYAPICRNMAEHGYEAVIVPMPFNLPTLGSSKGNDVLKEYSNIKSWAICGHSIGGSVASKFASKSDKIDGVIFLASYPIGDELNGLGKKVLSIWGSKDGVMDFEQLFKAKSYLPSSTEYKVIEGANHSQFADYGKERGDNDALISEKSQLKITEKSIIKFLSNLDN